MARVKVKDVLASLQKLVEEHPEALELDVITSIDDEGNSFNPVYYTPTLGEFDEDYSGFINVGIDKANAVCLN